MKIQCTKIIINVDQLSKLINGEEGKYRSLEVRASSSHLKISAKKIPKIPIIAYYNFSETKIPSQGPFFY